MMKFIISRTSSYDDEKPCKEATKGKATAFTDCTIKTIEKAMEYAWVKEGNPVQMKGFVRVYNKKPKDVWTIEIKDLEDLMKIYNKYGDIVIENSYYKEFPVAIEIYDSYRE